MNIPESTMRRHYFAIVFLLLFPFFTESFSQGEAALPFLLISPTTEANAMGEASVANITNDPLAFMSNPAILGIQSFTTHIARGNNSADWLPQFQQADLWYRTYGVTTGMNISEIFGFKPEVSLGMAYSNVYLNEGEIDIRNSNGTVLTSYNAFESSDQYTLALGLRYGIEASVGYTAKHIYSALMQFSVQGRGENVAARVDAYDLGLFVNAPLMKAVSLFREKPIQVFPNVAPFADVSFGFAKSNLGNDSVVYFVVSPAAALPRYARIGIGFNVGLQYEHEGISYKPLSFKWTIEANDILVQRLPIVFDTTSNGQIIEIDPHPSWVYRDGIGDIDFMNEVILGNSNVNTIKKKGWELTFFDFISIRGGRFEEAQNKGNRRFNTSGFGIRFGGLANFIQSYSTGSASHGVWNFLLNHFDVSYNYSNLSADEESSPLAGTTFNSVNVALRY